MRIRFMRRPKHANYLRAKATRFRELAAALPRTTASELLKLAEEMEAHAAELVRGIVPPVGGAANSTRPTTTRLLTTRQPLDERRLVFRVLHHWTEMAIAQRFPRKDSIDPWLVGDDWANCMMLKLDPDKEHSSFYVVGANLLPPGKSLEGASVADCPDGTVLAVLLGQLDRCIAHAAPVIVEGSTSHLGAPVRYRGVLLPLSEDGVSVEGIFGAANFKEIAR